MQAINFAYLLSVQNFYESEFLESPLRFFLLGSFICKLTLVSWMQLVPTSGRIILRSKLVNERRRVQSPVALVNLPLAWLVDQLSACGTWICCGSALLGGLFKGSKTLFTRVSE